VFVVLPDSQHIAKRRRLDEEPQADVFWLKELHSEIWGRKDRIAECFRQVEVTREHYDALQTRLFQKYPDRDSAQYNGKVHIVVDDKLDIIRPTAEPLHPDNDVDQVDGVDDPEAIEDDFELDSLFPSTLRYLDLSTLNLKEKSPRFPWTLFLRREYDHITRLIDEGPDNSLNSVIISGQPGTGEVIVSPVLHDLIDLADIKARPSISTLGSSSFYSKAARSCTNATIKNNLYIMSPTTALNRSVHLCYQTSPLWPLLTATGGIANPTLSSTNPM
jgi:hypothetical protein